MFKSFMIAGLSLISVVSQAACKLEKSIDLSTLNLDVQREIFWTADSIPKLNDIIERDDEDRASTLSISYTQFLYEPSASKVIGARLSYADTVTGIGLSDVYNGGRLERTIRKTSEGDIHTVKEFYGIDFKDITQMSELLVKDNKIIRIEITTSTRINGRMGYKTVCVTKAEK